MMQCMLELMACLTQSSSPRLARRAAAQLARAERRLRSTAWSKDRSPLGVALVPGPWPAVPVQNPCPAGFH